MADVTPEEPMVNIPEIPVFDPANKKKKKKKAVACFCVDDSRHNLVERADKLLLSEGTGDFLPGLKKKKPVGTNRSSDYNVDTAEGLVDSDDEGEEEDGIAQKFRCLLEGSEHIYKYDELLQRIYGFLHEHNPDLAGDKQRTVLRPPQVFAEGSTQTIFVNLMELCKTYGMHRRPEHVMKFMLTELATTGSLDGENRLVVKGRIAPKVYEDEYVLCHCCRSPDTVLSSESRILFLQCELCGSERSVAPIETGNIARVEHRKT